MQSEFDVQFSPTFFTDEGLLQGELESPGVPTYPLKQAPQVFAVALHSSLLRELHGMGTVQLTVLMAEVAAPITCPTKAGSLAKKALLKLDSSKFTFTGVLFTTTTASAELEEL